MSTRLRYIEYYQMQQTLDWLYARSKARATQDIDLMKIITSKENIMLAYRMIKTNKGSHTAGVDGTTINAYKMQNEATFIKEIRNGLTNYEPSAVRRIEIPKKNGKMRPLGIPTMRDRLLGQMIRQVITPICEARFYKHSYGFRENRSTHHAIARSCHLITLTNCHYSVDIDIKGFFDNVNHRLLIKQLYAIGVKDKRLLAIISKMLKAEIETIGIPQKGTPQGGVLSPLLSNVVLNDLDWWIAGQWEEFPTKRKYRRHSRFSALKKTKLKQMHIVRYADDFKIFTNSATSAYKTYHAVCDYLKNRLKLEISPEKSQVTNLRKRKSEFLGFELKAKKKRKRQVASTSISMGNQKEIKAKVKEKIREIKQKRTVESVQSYNAYVLGIHNYYKVATNVNKNLSKLAYQLSRYAYNQLRPIGKYEQPRSPPASYRKFYKNNYKTYRICQTYLYPLGDVKWKFKSQFSPQINDYTKTGREKTYQPMQGNINHVVIQLLAPPRKEHTVEYHDNRLSRYVMQNGKCAITGIFLDANDLECHHMNPRQHGKDDTFKNLRIVHRWVHKLIHATNEATIDSYEFLLKLTPKQKIKLNEYREKCHLTKI